MPKALLVRERARLLHLVEVDDLRADRGLPASEAGPFITSLVVPLRPARIERWRPLVERGFEHGSGTQQRHRIELAASDTEAPQRPQVLPSERAGPESGADKLQSRTNEKIAIVWEIQGHNIIQWRVDGDTVRAPLLRRENYSIFE